MKKLQSWVDLWAPDRRQPRPVFVGQMKAMLTDLIVDIDVRAARNRLKTSDASHDPYGNAMDEMLRAIERLK